MQRLAQSHSLPIMNPALIRTCTHWSLNQSPLMFHQSSRLFSRQYENEDEDDLDDKDYERIQRRKREEGGGRRLPKGNEDSEDYTKNHRGITIFNAAKIKGSELETHLEDLRPKVQQKLKENGVKELFDV